MNFYSLPGQFIGKAYFSPKSKLNGKEYKDMSDKEKAAFRQLFLDRGASEVACEDDGKYEYNYYIAE